MFGQIPVRSFYRKSSSSTKWVGVVELTDNDFDVGDDDMTDKDNVHPCDDSDSDEPEPDLEPKSKCLAIISQRPSCFVESLKPPYNPLFTVPINYIPFAILPAEDTERFCPLLAFPTSLKLPKEAHRLTGLLAGATTKVPDTLHFKDFQAR